MLTTRIHSYARKFHALRGTYAELEAAQKARELEITGSWDEAELWRRIRSALVARRRAGGSPTRL